MLYNTLLAALAIGAPVFAAPVADLASDAAGLVTGIETFAKEAFSIPQVATGQKIFRNGPAAYQKAYQKYKVQVPTHVAAAAAAVQSGSVTATPESYDEAYLCPVSVGTPGKTLMLDFDTGSADLWVFSSLQSSSQSSGHTIYTPSSSSTSRRLSGYTWDISYGDGSGAKGVVYSDKVVIGPVTATSQAVEAATSVSSSFSSDVDNDGLVGLAFSSINTVSPQQQTTFFDTVKSTLAKPLFASYLKAGKAGTYDFGYIDPNKYSGSFTNASVSTSNGFWQFTAGTGYAGSSSLGSIGTAIADTGTTLALLPDSVVSAYYSHVSGAQNSNAAGGWIFPCSATLPTFGVTIGGNLRTVPGSYINYAPNGDGTCYGGLQSSAGIGINILGDIFLKGQYVIYNSVGPTLSFAQSK